VEKAIYGLFPLSRPQETPPSRARLVFPGSTVAASSGGYTIYILLA